jgi:hypothetical protein
MLGEGDDGAPLEVVHDVPGGVEQPADADPGPALEPSVGDIGHDDRQDELPGPEPASAEVGGARTADQHGVDLASMRPGDQGYEGNADQPDDDRHDDGHGAWQSVLR